MRPRTASFYVFDRKTGEVISAKNFVPVNWTKGLDPKTFKPIIDREAVDYSGSPKAVYPWGGGAHSWAPMAYSTQTGLVYIPVTEGANILFDATDNIERRPALTNSVTSSIALGAFRSMPPADLPARIKTALAAPDLTRNVPHKGLQSYLDAWDPVRQQRVWRVAMANLFDRGGVLATGSGLVAQGNMAGALNFHDASSGALLHSIDTGTSIVAAPMTYSIGTEQYVAVMASVGGGPLSFNPPPDSAAYKYGNQGRILVFKLGGGVTPKPALLPPVEPIPQPPPLRATAEIVARGASLFAQNCSRCHANVSTRGSTPDLRRMSAATHAAFEQIVLKGALRPRGMPQWDDVLSESDTQAIHAHLISLGWEAFRQESEQRSGTSPAR
jgi:quinohemoprotein ethanol dehydrogenase